MELDQAWGFVGAKLWEYVDNGGGCFINLASSNNLRKIFIRVAAPGLRPTFHQRNQRSGDGAPKLLGTLTNYCWSHGHGYLCDSGFLFWAI